MKSEEEDQPERRGGSTSAQHGEAEQKVPEVARSHYKYTVWEEGKPRTKFTKGEALPEGGQKTVLLLDDWIKRDVKKRVRFDRKIEHLPAEAPEHGEETEAAGTVTAEIGGDLRVGMKDVEYLKKRWEDRGVELFKDAAIIPDLPPPCTLFHLNTEVALKTLVPLDWQKVIRIKIYTDGSAMRWSDVEKRDPDVQPESDDEDEEDRKSKKKAAWAFVVIAEQKGQCGVEQALVGFLGGNLKPDVEGKIDSAIAEARAIQWALPWLIQLQEVQGVSATLCVDNIAVMQAASGEASSAQEYGETIRGLAIIAQRSLQGRWTSSMCTGTEEIPGMNRLMQWPKDTSWCRSTWLAARWTLKVSTLR